MKGVPIKLDRVRHLRFTPASYRALADRFGIHPRQITAFIDEKGMETLPAFLWAGLVDEDPGLTTGRVQEFLRAYYKTPLQLLRLAGPLIKAAKLAETEAAEAGREG